MVQGATGFKFVDKMLVGKEVPEKENSSSIGELILDSLRADRDFVSMVQAETGKERTFGEYEDRSVRCALWLKRQGIRQGDIIGICVDNNLDTCVPMFATFYLAAVVSGWDHELSVSSARFFLTLISPKLVFINAASAKNLAKAAAEENMDVKIVVVGQEDGFQSLDDIIESVDPSEVQDFACTPVENLRDVACICWTSGSTGLPKGTELSQRSMIYASSPPEDFNIVDEVSMWTPSIRWNYGLCLFIESVRGKSKVVLIPDEDNDLGFFEYIEKYGVTYFSCDPCVPVRWQKFKLIEKGRLPTLKKFVVSGARFNAQKQRSVAEMLPHTEILSCYGMTDLGGAFSCQTKDSTPGSCGFICSGRRLKVVDRETEATLGPNETGELWLQSPSMMTGYHKNPKATKKILDEDGWLHSGDLGYYDENGEIFLVGRISEFINYRSINLSPAEIEAVLESHPSVLKAAVVPVPHDTDEEHPMAFIEKVPGKEVTEEELINLVKENMAWYCHLRGGVKILSQLPRTSTGKIAKLELKEMAKTYAEPSDNQ